MKTYQMTGLRSGFFLALIFALGSARADTIDFGAYADGTNVSATSPANGILALAATTKVLAYDGGLYDITKEATINGGVLAALPTYAVGGFDYSSIMTATFLSPVTQVSFQLENWRTAGYSYTCVGSDGTEFHGSSYLWGALENGSDLSWSTITLSIPPGGYLTEFSVTNHDSNPANAAFWVNDISYTPVPDNGPTIAMLGGAFAGLALLGLIRRKIAGRV